MVRQRFELRVGASTLWCRVDKWKGVNKNGRGKRKSNWCPERKRRTDTILWGVRISQRFSDNNNNRFCFCYRKQPQTLKNGILFYWHQCRQPNQQTLLFAQKEIFIQWKTESGEITVFYCSAVYRMKTFPFRGYFTIVRMDTMGFIMSIQTGARDYVPRGT